MALLNFKKGEFKDLEKAPLQEGTVYITTDEKAMYVDLTGSNGLDRIRIGQIISLTEQEWEAKKPPFYSDTFYYITDKNALLKYTNGAWKQINSTEVLSSKIAALETMVYGNSTTTGLDSRVGTLETSMSEAQGNINSLTTKVGNLESSRVKDVKVNGTSVVTNNVANITVGALASKDKVALSDFATDVTNKLGGYDTTISTLATKESLASTKSELEGKITTNTNNIATINNTLGTGFNDSTKTVAKVIADVNARIGDGFTSTNTVAKEIDSLKTRVSDNESDIEGLQTADDAIRGRLTSLETASTTQGNSINTINNTLTSHDERITAAKNRADKGVTDAAAAQQTANSAVNAASANATAIEEINGEISVVKRDYATKNELANEKSALKGLIDDNTALIEANAETLESHDTRITTAQNRADAAYSLAEGNGTNIADLTGRVDVIEGTYATDAEVEAIRATLAKNIADNVTTLGKHDTRITEAQNTANSAVNAAATNATEISGLKTTTQNLSNNKLDKTTYNTDKAVIDKGIADNKTAAANAQAKADSAYNYANANKGLIDGHLTRIAAIEGTLDKVTNVMDFLGVAKVAPTSTSVTLTNGTVISTLHKGDVVIFGNKEYVYDGTQWVEFGDASVNASEISDLTKRVETNEGNISNLQGRMTAAEGTISTHTTYIADRYTKDETNALITAALTWGTF